MIINTICPSCFTHIPENGSKSASLCPACGHAWAIVNPARVRVRRIPARTRRKVVHALVLNLWARKFAQSVRFTGASPLRI